MYSYEPPKSKDLVVIETKLPAVKNQLEETQKVVQTFKENLHNSRNRMKQQADQNRTEREFDVGEWVFAKLRPYKQLSLKQKGKNKLAPRFYGPY